MSWAAICLIWGTTYLAIRIGLETLPPALGSGLRWLTAGTILAAVIVARGGRLPSLRTWPTLALIGFLFITAGNGFVVWAEQWVPSGLTAVLLATTPFWMVGVELMWPGGERPRPLTWVGLLIGFAGIVLLVWPELTSGGAAGASFLLGVIALQGACLTWSIASAHQRRSHLDQQTLGGAAIEMVFGGLMLIAVGSATGEWPRLAFSARSAWAFTYLVVVGSIVGYSAYLHTLKHLPIATISLYSYINPIIAVILGTLVANEPFGLRGAVASLIVLLGVAVVRTTGPNELNAAAESSSHRDQPPVRPQAAEHHARESKNEHGRTAPARPCSPVDGGVGRPETVGVRADR